MVGTEARSATVPLQRAISTARPGLVHGPRPARRQYAYPAGVALTALGTAVTGAVLPLLAVVTVHATPFSVGCLVASGAVAPSLTALLSGSLADRYPRGQLITVSRLSAAAALIGLLVAVVTGSVDMPALCAAALLLGALSDVTTTAATALLPALAPPVRRFAHTSQIIALTDLASAVGAYLASALITVSSLGRALTADIAAAGFAAWSARHLPRRDHAQPSHTPEAAPGIWSGVRYVRRTPLLRDLVETNLILSVAGTLLDSVCVVMAVHYWHWPPAGTVVLLGCAGLGSAAGSAAAARLADRCGRGVLATRALLVVPVCYAVLCLSGDGPWWSVIIVCAVTGSRAARGCYAALARMMRQGATSPALQGRQHAAGTLLTCAPPAPGGAGGRMARLYRNRAPAPRGSCRPGRVRRRQAASLPSAARRRAPPRRRTSGRGGRTAGHSYEGGEGL
ncbi:MFS transporter [Streptomyces sp. 8L]|uniref:MFS transporter n=1 Tax=Streptomyces sp. 8L TaxID=2877242 RepID=UPI001CD689A9|nr:MFS transporter [Streptomyces sp. 8L]MCA1223262.1 MFS transporter [Streptomyces sp. 8L]